MDQPQGAHGDPEQINAVKPEFRWGIRAGVGEDRAIVANSWRFSYSFSQHTSCPGGLDEYIATQRAVIDQALATGEILVAFPAEPERREAQVLGWCCYRLPSTVHYVYVKRAFRGLGIAQALLQYPGLAKAGRIVSSHDWRCWGRYEGAEGLVRAARKAGVAVDYNPALIFGGTR